LDQDRKTEIAGGPTNMHENIDRHADPEIGSDRSFGLVFAAVFLAIALWPLVKGLPVRWWSLPLSAGFLVVALWRPALLVSLNRHWAKFGLLLGKIVSPVVFGLIFVLGVFPIAIGFRLTRKDPLRLKFDRAASTYWILRDPPGPPAESIRHQF
jgi:hypothetical protein